MPEIALSLLHPDSRNPNVCDAATLDKLQRHLARTRLCPPLIVRPHPTQDGAYQIIDGHHRKQIAEQLGWESLPCQIWQISEPEAQLALATLNRLRGTDSPKKRAALLSDLLESFPAPDLADLLPESEAEIRDLLRLLALDTEAAEQSLKQEMQRELATLPVAFSFLIHAQEATLVEQALQQAHASDRGKALVCICQSYSKLEGPHESS